MHQNLASEEVFRQFKELEVDGVKGVFRINSGESGPVLGITACTHGNEPAGLAVFDYLLNTIKIETALMAGSLYLVLNNIEAAEKFFAATSNEEIRTSRQVDVNMNRLPAEEVKVRDDSLYEVRRANELRPIWERFTVGLDIHSTTVPTSPMLISRGGNFEQIATLLPGFPVEILLSNIDRVQTGIPAFAMYGGMESTIPVFGIEAGQHTDPATFKRAIACTLALLQNLGMLPGTPERIVSEYREYLVEDSLLFDEISFDLVSEFRTFDRIQEGQVLARNTIGQEMLAPFSGHILFPTSYRGNEKDISEEMAFLSRPVKIRQI